MLSHSIVSPQLALGMRQETAVNNFHMKKRVQHSDVSFEVHAETAAISQHKMPFLRINMVPRGI